MSKGTGLVSSAVFAPFIIQPGRPFTRTTYQLRTELRSGSCKDSKEIFKEAVTLAVRWIQRKFPVSLPREALKGESFELEVPGQSTEAVALGNKVLWSARLVQPDSPFGDRPAVAGRTWTTEVGFALESERIYFTIRVICASLSFAQEPITFTRPRVVVEISNKLELWDVIRCNSDPWYIYSKEDLKTLLSLIRNPDRRLPVYALTQPDEREIGMRLRPFLLDEVSLSRGMLGLGHVVCLPNSLGFEWTGLVGKPWSVYRGAVRTYRSGLDFSNDPPSAHPLALANRVLAFHDRKLKGEEAFAQFLIEQAFLEATRRRGDFAPCLSFLDAKRRRAEETRAESTDTTELLDLYRLEIQSLERKISALEKEAESFNDDAIAAQQERDYYVDENHRLRIQAESLRRALSAKTGEAGDSQIQIPSGFEEMPEWVERHLAGRLELHPRTRQGLKTAVFDDSEIVYRALIALATDYRDMRMGYEGARESWECTLRELKLRFSPSIKDHLVGEQGEEYFVCFPLHSGRRRFLEFHLRKGTAKDQRFCLAIYFFWDEDTQQVIVGWLPSHLANRQT